MATDAQPSRPGEEPVPPPAQRQSGGLVSLGAGGLRPREDREQACLPLYRVLDLPLVPRDGTRILREGERRRRAQPRLRLDQGGPRGASGRGRHLHGGRADDDGERGLAPVALSDPGRKALLRRNLLPSRGPLRAARVRDAGRRDRGGVEDAAPRARELGGGPPRAPEGGRGRTGRREAGRTRDSRDRGALSSRAVRRGTRRVWRRAEVPARDAPGAPDPLLSANVRAFRPRDGRGDSREDGRRRNVRPGGRRFPPLLGGRPVARSPLREDALRQRDARARVPARLPRLRPPATTPGSRGKRSTICCAR